MAAEERLKELDRPIEDIGDIAVRLCEFLSCENCPVIIYDYDRRTEYNREMEHMPCCRELMSWIIDESKKIKSL